MKLREFPQSKEKVMLRRLFRKVFRRKHSLTLLVNQPMQDAIEEIGRNQGLTTPQVLRRSIAVLKFCRDEVRSGKRIIIRDAEGEPVKEIVGL